VTSRGVIPETDRSNITLIVRVSTLEQRLPGEETEISFFLARILA